MATASNGYQMSQSMSRISDVGKEPLKVFAPLSDYANMPIVSLENAVEPLISLLPDVQNRVIFAKRRCQNPPADGLTVDESASIILYTMGWQPIDKCLHVALNDTLRSDDRTKLEPWFSYLKLFLTALERLPSFEQTIYRGVRFDLYRNYPKGKSLIWWGVSSCAVSVDILRAEVFMGTSVTRTLIVIDSKSGKDIGKHSFYPSEMEILILPATQFKVVECAYHGQGYHVVHLEETTPFVPLRQPAIVSNLNSFATSANSITPAANARATDRSNILVWLDSNNDESQDNYRTTLAELKRISKMIYTFADPDRCTQFLTEKCDKNIFFITSGGLGQHVVPIIHDMSQINAIFIFCGYKARHELWAKNWSKVKGVFIEFVELCEVLKQCCQQSTLIEVAPTITETLIEVDPTTTETLIEVPPTTIEPSNQDLDQLDSSLMFTQILKEILLQIQFDDKHIKDFVTYCREQFAGNDNELEKCNRFEQEYHEHTPIWWYTYDSFLHRMLNKALRTTDIDLIVKMGFFIQDLHRQIEQIHAKQIQDNQHPQTLTVYRGQGMPKTDFEHLKKKEGGLLSFNSFLSASQNGAVSLTFAETHQYTSDLIGVLFIITIDPSMPSVPFALVQNIAYYPNTEDVLFSMHTIFRIGDIRRVGSSIRFYKVNLVLTNHSNEQLRTLTDRLRIEIEGPTGWHRLGKLLVKLGLFSKAEAVYKNLLYQTNSDSEKLRLYDQLGMTTEAQGENQRAIRYYQKSLELRHKTLSPNHPDIAESYSNIGSIYEKMLEHSAALSFYEKAVEIGRRSLPLSHPNLEQWKTKIAIMKQKN